MACSKRDLFALMFAALFACALMLGAPLGASAYAADDDEPKSEEPLAGGTSEDLGEEESDDESEEESGDPKENESEEAGDEKLSGDGELPIVEDEAQAPAPAASPVRYKVLYAASTTAQSQELSAQGNTETRPNATVKANAHVQNKGWLGDTAIVITTGPSGTVIGTTGQGLRLEALRFSVAGAGGTVQAQAHVQNVGWQGIVSAGKDAAGTSGRSLRVEAIRLALTGELSQWYDITYRAHVQNKGWLSWVSNGGTAGTSGESLRMEALEIKLVPKGSKSAEGDGIIGLRANAHVQNVGWQGQVLATASAATTGTTGRSLRVEALQLALDAGSIGGGIQINAHVQNKGWLGYKSNSNGTTGQSLRMEAVQIQLTGKIKDVYDIVYRAHVQNVGWQPWTLDGGTAGTSGRSLRVEALQIKLVKKNSSQSVGNGTYFISFATDPNAVAQSTGGAGAQATTAGYSANSTNERYYVRNENGGITLQNVATGMFLEASGSSVVQRAYSASSAAQVWNIAWNSGYALTNKATHAAAARSGNKLVTGAANNRWMLTGTSLVPDGNYVVSNVAAGKVLDVSGASWNDGANIMVHNANNGGNQVFTFAHTGSDVYKVTSAMTGKAVDVAGSSKAEGANVQQYRANGSNAQLWKADIDRTGKLVFTNRASGKVLTAAGSGASGANVTSSANAGKNTQKWTLKPSSYVGDAALQRAVSIAQGLSSSTRWLITVDLSAHKLVVFQGSRGNWSVYRSWTVTNGAHGTPTVVGDFTVGSRGYSFGHGYTCYYWTQFHGDYLFHSVIYHEGTRVIRDGTLGAYRSMGCVRMDINNAKWIHDNIPSGTHVKTYN